MSSSVHPDYNHRLLLPNRNLTSSVWKGLSTSKRPIPLSSLDVWLPDIKSPFIFCFTTHLTPRSLTPELHSPLRHWGRRPSPSDCRRLVTSPGQFELRLPNEKQGKRKVTTKKKRNVKLQINRERVSHLISFFFPFRLQSPIWLTWCSISKTSSKPPHSYFACVFIEQ